VSSGQQPKRDKTPAETFIGVLLGGGGFQMLGEFAISFIPDSAPQKAVLKNLLPWASSAVGAGFAWGWANWRNRATKNDQEEGLLLAAEYYERLLLDPAIPSRERQHARKMLAHLRTYQADVRYTEATGKEPLQIPSEAPPE
jgi:hypothetical protein